MSLNSLTVCVMGGRSDILIQGETDLLVTKMVKMYYRNICGAKRNGINRVMQIFET